MIDTADSVQGVIFLSPGEKQEEAKDVWTKLFPSDSPDGFQKATGGPMLGSTATGERAGYYVTLLSQVGRVLITLNASPAPPTPAGPPRIADAVTATVRLGEFVKQLSKFYRPTRIALICDRSISCQPGQESKYFREQLGELIPQNASDLVFQVNVRKTFDRFPDIQMNRFCTWATGHVGVIPVGLGTAGPGFPMSFFVGLKVDTNTAPEIRALPSDIDGLIDELMNENLEVFRSGYSRLT